MHLTHLNLYVPAVSSVFSLWKSRKITLNQIRSDEVANGSPFNNIYLKNVNFVALVNVLFLVIVYLLSRLVFDRFRWDALR